MKDYLKRYAELVSAAFAAGAAQYVVDHGLDLSSAGLQGLGVAGAMAVYGLIVKRIGDRNKPTVSK